MPSHVFRARFDGGFEATCLFKALPGQNQFYPSDFFNTLYFQQYLFNYPCLVKYFCLFSPHFFLHNASHRKSSTTRIFESFHIFSKQSGPMFAHVIPLSVCFLYLDLVRYLPTSSCTLLPPTSSITGALSDSPHWNTSQARCLFVGHFRAGAAVQNPNFYSMGEVHFESIS